MRRIIIGIGIVLIIVMTVLIQRHDTPTIQNGATETNLPVIGWGRPYDLLVLGSSHARILSRFDHHQMVERLLQRSMINLAQGGNRESIRNQHLYLRYFFQRRNTTSTVVYFLDPYVFFRHTLLDSDHVFEHEPFRLDFLRTLLREGEWSSKTLSYLGSAFTSKDLPPTTTKETISTAERRKARRKELYREEPSQEMLAKDLENLLQIVELAQRHHARVIVIVPPTLLPRTKQDDRVMGMLGMLQQYRQFELYDLRGAILEEQYYLDADHLNTEGSVQFMKTSLFPILKNR